VRARIFSRGRSTGSRDVISGQKAPTRADIVQLPVAHAHTLPREHLRCYVTSGSHVGHAQWYILYYYYSKKKVREPVVHVHAITSVTFGSGHVIFADVSHGQDCFWSRDFW
jgi:hypothetical protein